MLLDTNAYTALALSKPSIVEAIKGVPSLALPLPVLAELRYGFVKGVQQARNELILQKFMAQPQVTIAIPTLFTTELYAELQLQCQQRGKVLSQNDIWIGALTLETDDILATFDKDFLALSEVLGKKLLILN